MIYILSLCRKRFLVLLCLLLPFTGNAAKEDPLVMNRGMTRLDMEYGLGMDVARYRDFATSPLFYWGPMAVVPLNIHFRDEFQEIRVQTRNSIGIFNIYTGRESTFSYGFVGNLRYDHLIGLKRLRSDRWNFMAGGCYDLTSIVRMNTALLNNASGYEFLGTLSASFKTEWDLSRRTERVLDIILWKLNIQPRQRVLSWKLDIGLVNSALRNGYAYLGQEVLLNGLGLFDGYKLDLLTGFRIGSQLEYMYLLQNGNGMRFSYIWDAVVTGGDLPSFEMAHHIFQFTLLYKLNRSG